MSSYPPGGDYDERLLDSAPKATKLEMQEGYNVNLLASDTSETPMNARPPATVDGHASLEAGVSPTKEGYTKPFPVPWHRQKKWRIIMLVAVIVVIGAVAGGVAGGVLASKNKGGNKSNTPNPTSATSTPNGAPTQTSVVGAPPPGSTHTPPASETGANTAVPTNDGNSLTSFPTQSVGGNIGGRQDFAPVVARHN